jgi:hypothetical protein
MLVWAEQWELLVHLQASREGEYPVEDHQALAHRLLVK